MRAGIARRGEDDAVVRSGAGERIGKSVVAVVAAIEAVVVIVDRLEVVQALERQLDVLNGRGTMGREKKQGNRRDTTNAPGMTSTHSLSPGLLTCTIGGVKIPLV